MNLPPENSAQRDAPKRDHSHDETSIDVSKVVPMIALVVIIVFGGYFYFSDRSARIDAQGKLAQQIEQNANLQKQMANLEATMSEIKVAKLFGQQNQAVSSSNAQSVIDRGSVIKLSLNNLERTLTHLSKRQAELAHSELGKRIASDPSLVEQANVAFTTQIPSATLAQSLHSRLDLLLKTPKQVMQEQTEGFYPTEELTSSLNRIEAEALEAIDSISQVGQLLDAVEAASQGLPPNAERDLAQSIAALELEHEQERLKIIADKLEEARREGAKLLANQEANDLRKIDEAKRLAMSQEAEQTAAKIISDAKETKAEFERQQRADDIRKARVKLENEFEDELADIKNYLTAFLTDGYKFRADGLSGPASLSEIRSSQMLREGRFGLERLLYLVSSQNDRPRGPIESSLGGELGWERADKDTLGKVQGYLIKYGELLVEKGMLEK